MQIYGNNNFLQKNSLWIVIGAILIFTGIYLVTKENHNEKN